MTDTMNDMSPEEKHSYDRYMLEVMQMEYERDEQVRQLASSTYSTYMYTGEGCGEGRLVWHGQESALLCWRCDREAEYAGYCEEHYAMRQEENTLQELLEHDEWVEGRDATQDDEMAWDVWLDDLYSREELERMQALREEDRNDH